MKIGSQSRFGFLLLILLVILTLGSPDADAQRKRRRSRSRDSLLTLLNAEYARVFERPGHREFREVKGPATFLHNGAYMFCDSAIWNVSLNQVEAYQNVKLVQDKTVVKSDNVIYYGDDNIARFRGDLVEVYDKDKNTLRTKYLDYNTEDSTAKFSFGGAMKTAEGEVIESERGTYDAKTGICRFEDNVEMFTDSLFIRTSSLDYDTNQSKAYFGKRTQMWKRDIYMRGDYGWYLRDSGVVYFDTAVYMNNPDYEAWCDSLYYWQHSRRGRMRRNVQLLDSLNNTYFVSDAADMDFDSVNNLYATLFLNPASVFVGENSDNQIDTLFCRADTMLFYTQRVCDITDEQKKDSEEALKQVNFDAIGEAEKKAREKKEQEKKAAIEKLPEYIAYKKRQEIAEKKRQDSLAAARGGAVADSLAVSDSLAAVTADVPAPAGGVPALGGAKPSVAGIPALRGAKAAPGGNPALRGAKASAGGHLDLADAKAVADTLATTDSLAVAPARDSLDTLSDADRDTTQLRFLKGYRNVRIYRTDIQARCDSIYFSQIDTLLRMFQDPVIWNDNRHQLTGEEVVMQMKDNSFDRANIHGGAMIISQEDTVHFDQIKSTEMLGYFNSDNTLRRFDALGGVNAMFYMEEDSVITILNSKQAQFMMVTLKDGVAQKLKYYESVNSDAFPVYNLPVDKQRLKGFKWRIDEQPKSRFDITHRTLLRSRRASYAVNRLPQFRRTDMYFDGYMKDIYRQIEERAEQARLEQARLDSLEAVRQEEESRMAADTTLGIHTAFDSEGGVIIDSLATMRPAPAKQDTVPEVKPAGIEGVENHSKDGFVEVRMPADTKNLTPAEKRALRKAARELRRQQKKLEREARKAKRAALRAERAAKRAAAKAEREARRAAQKAAAEARKAEAGSL